MHPSIGPYFEVGHLPEAITEEQYAPEREAMAKYDREQLAYLNKHGLKSGLGVVILETRT